MDFRCLEVGMKPELIDRTIPKQKNNQENQSKQAVQRTKPLSTYKVNEQEESLLQVKIETEVSEELNNDIGHLEEQSDHSIFQVNRSYCCSTQSAAHQMWYMLTGVQKSPLLERTQSKSAWEYK